MLTEMKALAQAHMDDVELCSCPGLNRYMRFPAGSVGKESTCNAADAGDTGSVPGPGRFPWRRKTTHSSILAWGIPWTEEPGGLGTDSETTDD